MARAKAAPAVSKPASGKTKKTSGSLVGALIGVALVFAAFFLGAQYFTAKRSTTAVVCATGFTKEHLTAYRLPSGTLDKFQLPDQSSPAVEIPMAAQFTIVDAAKKRVKPDSFALDPQSPKVLTITINPKDAITRIEEMPGAFRVQGSATVKGKREIVVEKNSYFIGGTLVLSAGSLTGNPGEDLEGTVATGDVVTLTGHGDQVAVLDIIEKAGTVSVSSNVEGARVYVDGALRGKTPCVFTATPGERQVLVRADGYTEKRLPVFVSSMGETSVEASLIEVTGTVSVSSTPSGATVTVSGQVMGATPLTVTLKPGPYEIAVERNGYYPKKSQVLVVQDVDQPLSFTLVKKPGTPAGPDGDDGQDGSSTGGYQYSETGVVLARDASSLFIGDRWTECRLASGAVAFDGTRSIPVGQIEPGDTVTVYGDSPSSVRMVRLVTALPDKWPFEGFLVRTGSGYKVFGDSSVSLISVPDDLQVVDPANRTKQQVAGVPSGSRVKLYVDGSGRAVWAEYIWKAGASAEGTLGSISGAAVRVAPSWEDLYISTETVVFVDTRRSGFYDLRVGDVVVAAGPHSGDLRFVWVRSRPASTTEVQAVALSTGGKTGKTLQEYRGRALEGHTILVGGDVALFNSAEKRTVPASELQAGDRVRVWLDENRRIAFGEVTGTNGFRVSTTYFGEEDGYFYFTGFSRYTPSEDMIVTGLAAGEKLEPGSKVLVAGTGAEVNYIEVLSEVTTLERVTGTVLGTRDTLHIRQDGAGITPYTYAKDTCFADFVLRTDGLVSTLFPGDKVSLSLGLTGAVVFAERTYSPPFKFEGTIEAVSPMDQTLIVSDKTTRKTISLASTLAIMKDGDPASIYELAPGDKVKVSGRDKASVNMVVVGQ